MTTEEIGDDPGVLAAMAAKGSDLRLLCPTPTDPATQDRLDALAQAVVQIRTLISPYVHAKTIITATHAFIGSQNLSTVSLQNNREMGVLVTGSARAQLAAWFQRWWAQATPWPPTSSASSAPALVSHNRPWLPGGASMATVRQLWGPPERTYPTTYHGQAQTAWVCPTAILLT